MKMLEKTIKYFKSKKGKTISFFVFYFFFFIFLFIYINAQDLPKNTSIQNNKPDNEIEESLNYYETSNLEKSDYLYKITIQNNNELQILEGSKSNKESINNYEYYEFVDLNELKRIIKNSKYLSKSLYSENNYKVNYEISNNDLYRLFDIELESSEINNIILTVKENSDLKSIEFDFSNYIKSIKEDVFLYKVLIEYEY